jgi:hypothetical protein
MFKIVRQSERYMIVAASDGPVADDVTPDVKFKLLIRGVWDESVSLGRLHDGTNMEGLLRFLKLLEIHVEEANCGEIVEVFDGMQPRKEILEGDADFDQPRLRIRSGKEDVLQSLTVDIQPPVFSAEEGTREITLWTIDLWSGDLEQWKISEDSEGERRIESEVVESKLIYGY